MTDDYKAVLSVEVDTETGAILGVYLTADDLADWPSGEVSFFAEGADDAEPSHGDDVARKARAIADRIECSQHLAWRL